jgi:leader peptidase (prepilin peptidase) / N-methyltransferase
MTVGKIIDPNGGQATSKAGPVAGPSRTVLIAASFAALMAAAALPAFDDLSGTAGVLPASIVLGIFLALLGAFDARFYWLPDILTLPLGLIGLMFCLFYQWDDVAFRMVAMMAGFMTLYLIGIGYQRWRGRAGLGLGDAKLLAAGGAWLGLAGLPGVLLIACTIALLTVIAMAVRGHAISATTPLPFGPFLAIGIWIVWVYGPVLG